MNRTLIALVLLSLVAGGLLGCTAQNDPSAVVEAAASEPQLPTQAPTAVSLLPTTVPTTFFTPIPTASSTAVPPPATATPNPTATATATATTHPDLLIDRTCPNPAPLKPPYNREAIGQSWPTPSARYEQHLWLRKPLPGGGRYLHNMNYPYGHDGNGSYLLHNGIDSGAPLGTAVLAVGDGTILLARSDEFELHGWRCDWYGNFVVLELDRTWRDQPLYALYAHLDEFKVEEGERVTAGQEIATVGMSGVAIQPHLHFEVRVGENSFEGTRNPMLWVQSPETRGVLAGRLLDPNGRPWQGVVVTAIGWEGSDNQHITWTYLDDPRHMINPDEQLGENFVFADLKPGRYKIYARVQGKGYQTEAEVFGGQVTTVELGTEAYKTRTPTPEPIPPTATSTNTKPATTPPPSPTPSPEA